jgi:hypothetical protein
MDVIKILMENGVKVNEKSKNIGLTPLEFAKKIRKKRVRLF